MCFDLYLFKVKKNLEMKHISNTSPHKNEKKNLQKKRIINNGYLEYSVNLNRLIVNGAREY